MVLPFKEKNVQVRKQTLLPYNCEMLSQSTKLILSHDLALHGNNKGNKLYHFKLYKYYEYANSMQAQPNEVLQMAL